MEITETKKGYKQTRLGWIPEDWEVNHVGHYYDFKNGLNKEKEFFGYGTPIINYKDVYQHTTLKKDDVHGLVTVNKSEKERYSTKRGDVFFTRTSETINEIGYTSVLTEDIKEGVFSGFVLRARPKEEDLIYPEFAGYCFNTFGVRKEIIRKSTYTTRALTNGSFLSEVYFAIPPYAEQKSIADSLHTWDTAITKLNALIKAKQKSKKGLMQQLLTGKKRLPGFDGEWETKRIEDFAREYSQKNSKDEDIEVLSCTKYDGLVPSLEYFGRQVFGDNLSGYKVVPRGYFAYATNHIEEGSIGYQNIMDVGLVSPMYTVFKTDEDIHDDFFFRVLKSHRLIHEYNRHMEGSINRRGGLRWKNFRRIKVTIPKYKEQVAISQVLYRADEEIQLLQEQLTQIGLQKRGMMQQLLTGKKRLKE
jgi:type I restriction enzyme S subunit